MKISKIKIKNYRLLKDFTIELEDDLSLVIGKNNTGKTSFLSVLERFLLMEDASQFTFDDFNLDFQKRIEQIVEEQEPYPQDEVFGINLKIYINYNEHDDLGNISKVMLELDPSVNTVVISYEYSMEENRLQDLKSDYREFKKEYIGNLEEEKKDLLYFLGKNFTKYFTPQRKALEDGNESNLINLKTEKISINKIISFKRIKAKRDVTNTDGTNRSSDRTLSKLASKYYSRVIDKDDENAKELKTALSSADDKLHPVLNKLLQPITNKIGLFGGMQKDESNVKVLSDLEGQNSLSENTIVKYGNGNQQLLPEDYNGLGYLNLIALIFEIEILLYDFKRKDKEDKQPADINLLFIEEPEAHTHPQMQYVFIKNIKNILENARQGNDDSIKINLQTIITTHSSHITAESNFSDIKYFYKDDSKKIVEAKNLTSLEVAYENDPKNYQFLKQYLTISRSEVFFADKIILIEGDTERLLLPIMMKKLDLEKQNDDKIPLLSQNISIVEVGHYTNIYDKFIEFLGIKTLIITDIDSIGSDEKKCLVKDGIGTSNPSLKRYLRDKSFNELKSMDFEKHKLSKNGDNWEEDSAGRLCITFQKEENAYHARSFEDAFIHLNLDFIKKNKADFKGLKPRKKAQFDSITDAYQLADECIKKKTNFALDILFHSDEKYTNWEIPEYIKKGLLWLQE